MADFFIYYLKFMNTNKRGLTLIELLIVIGIIATMASVVIVTINPGKIFQDTRNVQRKSHVDTIYLGFNNYITQHRSFPDCLTIIPEDTSSCAEDLVPTYLSNLPEDPHSKDGLTGYKINRSYVPGKVCVEAPHAERGERVSAGVCDYGGVDFYRVTGFVDDYVYRHEPDGVESWNYNAGEGTMCVEIDDNNNVYVGTTNGSIYKINTDGSLIWKYDTGSTDTIWNLVISADNNTLYANTRDYLKKIDLTNAPSDGSIFTDEEVWLFSHADGQISTFDLHSDGDIYLISFNSEDNTDFLMQIDLTNAPSDGSIFTDYVWMNSYSGNPGVNAVKINEEKQLFVSASGEPGILYKLDENGNEIWANEELIDYDLGPFTDIHVNSVGNILISTDYGLVALFSDSGNLLDFSFFESAYWLQTFGGNLDNYDHYYFNGEDGNTAYVVDARGLKSKYRHKEYVGYGQEGTTFNLLHSPVDSEEEVVVYDNQGEQTTGFVVDYQNGVITFDDTPEQLYDLGSWDGVLVSYTITGNPVAELSNVAEFNFGSHARDIAPFK